MRFAAIPMLVLAGFLLSSCGKTDPGRSHRWLTMGTFAELTSSASGPLVQSYRDITVSKFDLINRTLSIWDATSEISQINAMSGVAPVEVTPTTLTILELARNYATRSGGLFDPTIAPVIRLWGFSGGTTRNATPSSDEIANSLAVSGSHHLVLSNNTARLALKGMMIDLGGIAKGYAVDLAYEELRKDGAQNLMINLGGNIRCLGKPTARRNWGIGVQDPFHKGKLIGSVALPPGMAVATSGNYERYIEIDGERYAHIIDPRTGYPVKNTAGVTVISPTATEADALSTSFYVAGVKQSGALLSAFPESHVLIVPDEQPMRIMVSEGFRKFYTPSPGANIELLSTTSR